MLTRIGEIEIWRLLEMNAPFKAAAELYPTVGPDAARIINETTPGQVCATSGAVILPVQGFLLKTPDQVILIDSCVGNHKTAGHAEWHQRSDDRFMAALKAAGMTVEDVDYVLCTHLHVDHVGWNTRLENGRWVPTFPNAKYLLPAADEAYHRSQDTALYTESVLPVIAAGQAEMVTADHMLGDYISLMPTPGHTPGHVSVMLKSGDARAIITGDAIHITAQCRYPDWQFLYDADGAQAVQSRRALLEEAATSGCCVIGSHFALPSIGRVRAKGDVFEWQAD